MKSVEPPDYEGNRRNLYESNRREVRDLLNAGQLEKKIKNFCELHGFSREQLVQSIHNNDVVAAFFAKDPRKQSCDEKLAAQFIRNLEGVKNFKSLPKGPNGFCVLQGEVMPKKQMRGSRSTTKTIDFYWEYRGVKFYAAHKYTKDEGGAQGNQHRDLEAFIREARDSSLPKTIFMVIADGDFYQRRRRGGNRTRLQKMETLCTPGIYVTTSGNLSVLLPQISESIKSRKE